MNNQLCINPAYTGVRNTISTSLNAKKQWIGVDGSPTTYMLGINAPINKTYSAIGGYISSYQVGPVNNYNLYLSYAHLLKLGDYLHLSLGLNAGAVYQNISLSKINVVSSYDPLFQADISNEINADFGVGGFLYSPTYYIGLSIPHLIQTNFSAYEDIASPKYKRSIYLSSGLMVQLNKKLAINPSILYKINEDSDMNLDLNTLLDINNKFSVGFSYRIKHTISFITNIQISKQMMVGYSYDMNKSNSSIGKNSHEICICFDSYKYSRKNKKRGFKRKKKKQKEVEEDDSMKSIRHF